MDLQTMGGGDLASLLGCAQWKGVFMLWPRLGAGGAHSARNLPVHLTFMRYLLCAG